MGIKIGRFQRDIRVYRHEEKYYINKVKAYELSFLLNSYMRMDEHAEQEGSYWIRSLYFDNNCNRDYQDKQSGILERKKLRLRIYNLSTDSVKLELKNKYGIYMLKESVTISRKDARLLTAGETSDLLKYDSSVASKV